jgi:putative alpha-1,2-mannosidase
MNIRRILILCITIASLAACNKVKEPVDYVNPYMGNISHILVPTFPTVQLPNSILRVYPDRDDYTGEYLRGLPIVVTNHRERSAFTLSVSLEDGDICAPKPLNYDNERITPYSYRVTLENGIVDVCYAVSHQSAMYEISSAKPLRLSLWSFCGQVGTDSDGIYGSQTVLGDTNVYVYLQFLQKPCSKEVFDNHIVLSFDTENINIRYGVSFISWEQAKSNLLRELSDYDICALEKEGRRIWNETLSKIRVKGGTEDEKTVFYTSYYRTFERPICISEGGRYWSASDSSVHEDGGVPYYTDDWIWDTYRAAHPLRVLMDSSMEEDILASFLRMASESGTGWAPSFPEVSGDSRRMNSNHSVATFADAVVKGLSVDIPSALSASYKALTEKTLAPWSGAPASELDNFFWKNGFVAALRPGEIETDSVVNAFEKRQPVAVTLGTAYDCWCLSVLAREAGDKELASRFEDYSQRFRTIFNPQTLFFHPKDKDGIFIENVDYNFPGGLGAREYYAENNAWIYRWDVQHDIPSLIELMGGSQKFVSELDRMFATPLGRGKYQFYAKLPDHTGNVGQFSMANEPSLHVPYLYNYAGQPWKTQKRIRQMLSTWFRNDLMGLPGDEDGGGMSSFVVFSAIGIYPVTPGSLEYAIGSPLFEKVSMTLSNGKTFTVLAPGASSENKYIKRATLDGKQLSRPFIKHSDIMAGCTLELEMTDKPCMGFSETTE